MAALPHHAHSGPAEDLDRSRQRAVILGAGPAGLTAAYELDRLGISVTVLEKDPEKVGGIARTATHNGYRFDIGGHRFFSKNQEIEDLWTELLGGEMLSPHRLSRIYYRGRYFDYPLRATNAFVTLGPIETLRCAASYARAKLFPVRNPRTLEEWVSNQFGRRLFGIFFKTYTEKVWGIPTSQLSADWAAQRIRGLDLGTVIRTALFPQRGATGRDHVIKTLIDSFRYPRRGPGQLWEHVRDLVVGHGNDVLLDHDVVELKWDAAGITSVVANAAGSPADFEGDHFVSTMPMRDLVRALRPAPPQEVIAAAESLRYRDFVTVALMIDRTEVFPDNWIYIHEPGVMVGRMQNFKNWSAEMVPDQTKTCIGLEYFCFEGDGLWTSSDEDLVKLATDEMVKLGMCSAGEVFDGAVVRQPKAYPVYDDDYVDRVNAVRDWLSANLPNLYLCGRNGMHKYNNQDHSMMTALLVARQIAEGSTLDPWNVNADAEYLEELRGSEDSSGRLVPRPLDA